MEYDLELSNDLPCNFKFASSCIIFINIRLLNIMDWFCFLYLKNSHVGKFSIVFQYGMPWKSETLLLEYLKKGNLIPFE